MEWVLLAAMIWLAIHIGISGTPARDALVARYGAQRFMIGYSLASIASIVLLAATYKAAPFVPLWVAPAWLRWLTVLLMLPASILLVASVAAPNPTAFGQPVGEPAWVQRITRHPMMVAITVWALLHLLANGDLASLIFFGAFAATTLAGMPSIDRKIAERDPAGWQRLAAESSIAPGAALLAGRARLIPSQIPAATVALGTLLWLALLLMHPIFVGVPAVP